ncbi:MAG: hypothetical protein ABR915_07595 [Thermoguttaceae bacterium]|jgi:hypothetical protein
MKRTWILLAVAACSVLPASGDDVRPYQPGARPYQPAVAAPTTNVYGGGGWSGYYGGGGNTVAGSALNGMSQVISAAGEYNLNTSAAAINMTQAQSNAMQNQVQAVNTFWEMRNIGKAQRAAERGPPPTPEQIARIAREGVPRSLTPSQIDPVSGRLNWPSPLQDSSFDAPRGQLDEVVAKWVNYGGLDYSDKSVVRETVNTLFDGLKANIREIPPQDYVASRSFLQSLVYATTKTTLQ